MSGRARAEVIAALLVVSLFAAIVGPVWWQRWRDGDLAGSPAPSAGAEQPTSGDGEPSAGAGSASPVARRATVLRVSDGDTIRVDLAGRATTVRILNIDTPETHKAGTPVECLGPQASAALTELLPVGSTVDLFSDGPAKDRYGRTLAAVRRDGNLVAEEMARRGFTAGIVVSGADTWLAPVAAAQQEAMLHQRGLYDPNIPCTVAGQVEARVAALAVQPAGSEQEKAVRRERLTSAIGPAQQLRAQLALPDSKQKATYRHRHPAAWRHGQVQRLDTALAAARKATASP